MRSASSTSRSGARQVRLDLPTGVQTDIDHGWFLVQPRNAWTVGGKDLAGRLPARHPARRLPRRQPRFTLLFEPGQRRILNGHTWNAGRLILSIPDNLAPVFEVLDARGRRLGADDAGRPAAIGVVDVWSLDVEPSEANGDLLASAQDPLTPSSLMLLEPGRRRPC